MIINAGKLKSSTRDQIASIQLKMLNNVVYNLEEQLVTVMQNERLFKKVLAHPVVNLSCLCV